MHIMLAILLFDNFFVSFSLFSFFLLSVFLSFFPSSIMPNWLFDVFILISGLNGLLIECCYYLIRSVFDSV